MTERLGCKRIGTFHGTWKGAHLLAVVFAIIFSQKAVQYSSYSDRCLHGIGAGCSHFAHLFELWLEGEILMNKIMRKPSTKIGHV